MLEIADLTAGYGGAEVLHAISLSVAERQVVALVGPNGAGKTTLMHAIMGLLPSTGHLTVMGEPSRGTGWLVRHGVVLVPETRALFTDMSVEDNLLLGGFAPWRRGLAILGRRSEANRTLRAALDDAFAIFPQLAGRRRQLAGTLSGGERQMLALGRALMGRPRLLLLDEPSLGLAPKVVAEIFRVIAGLRDRGIAILLVEQNARAALAVSDYGYVLEMGRVALHGPSAALADNPRIAETYLGRRQTQA